MKAKIMDRVYYENLLKEYKNTSVKNLPEPYKGVPLTSEDYDYKTYWVSRKSREAKKNEL